MDVEGNNEGEKGQGMEDDERVGKRGKAREGKGGGGRCERHRTTLQFMFSVSELK